MRSQKGASLTSTQGPMILVSRAVPSEESLSFSVSLRTPTTWTCVLKRVDRPIHVMVASIASYLPPARIRLDDLQRSGHLSYGRCALRPAPTSAPRIMHPAPCTPAPCTPAPCTLHLCTLHPAPRTPHTAPYTPHPTPHAVAPRRSTASRTTRVSGAGWEELPQPTKTTATAHTMTIATAHAITAASNARPAYRAAYQATGACQRMPPRAQ